jgi:hypothetical protein
LVRIEIAVPDQSEALTMQAPDPDLSVIHRHWVAVAFLYLFKSFFRQLET